MFTNRGKALTFDDILLVPSYSEVTPDAVDISTWLTPSIGHGHQHGAYGRHRHHP